MKKIKKALAAILTLMLLMGLLPMTAVTTLAETSSDTLVVGYSEFSGTFSSLFYSTAYDEDVASMTTIHLLNSDRHGAIVDLGKTGVTRSYNGTNYTYYGPADLTITKNEDGTVYYDFDLREDIKFSDGTSLTADDVIFSMYALADPSYDGASIFYSLPIKGMAAYRAGYAKKIDLIAEAGRDNTDFTYWTEDQQKAYWNMVDNAPLVLAEEIANYCWDKGFAAQGDVSAAAGVWGFDIPENGTLEDFTAALINMYGDNVIDMIEVESAGSRVSDFLPDYDSFTEGVVYGDSAENIEGVQKTGTYSLRVILTEMSATAAYQFSIPILPLHYYGDSTKYDYDSNKFGFDKGDLSTARAKTSQPMGAGPYKFVKYEDGVVYFEANPYYYLGTPKTKYVQFKEVSYADKLSAIVSGEVDITDPPMTADIEEAIKETNSNGELTGDKLTTITTNNLGYGYLGINANVVKVGNVSGSDASKNLRKAFATVLSRFREKSIADYYGDRASVINYPISDTSWAAPQKTDADYEVAFSKDINNNQIYLDSMTEEGKTAAALEAALGYFQAAGYTVADGIVTAAPAGAQMEFEVWVPGGGVGDHPVYQMAQNASNALATIGITLTVKDLRSSSDLWEGLYDGEVPMWTAAWGAATDPDMYQIYYSDVANGGRNPGGSNFMYAVADAELDRLILEARSISDITQRKAIYKQCLDIIMDWAVEVPVYQRQNCVVFSTERLDMNTVTPDITPYYGWMSDVQNIKKAAQGQEEQYADYTAVNTAKTAAAAINRNLYTAESLATLDAAVAAVVEGKLASEQAAVDAMAAAINEALAGLVMKPADYSAVEEAKAAAATMGRDRYTSESLAVLDAAVAAVVEGKLIDEQEEVDAMAAAIIAAIDGLVVKPADYTAVNTAKAAAAAIDRNLYTTESLAALDAALAAVVEGESIDEQEAVDAMAAAINAAIAGLAMKPADYTAVNTAKTAAAAINRNLYTAESLATLDAAVAAVVEGKLIDEQEAVDAMAAAINDAIAALVEKPADYTAVNTAKTAAAAVDRNRYTAESLATLDAAVAAVVEGKLISEQAAVDAMAKAINDAIAALVVKTANYTAVNEAKAAAAAIDRSLYTADSLAALDAAVAAVVEGKPIDEQEAVDAMAAAINAAIAGLAMKPADYTAVNTAKAAAAAVDRSLYTEESLAALDAAVAAVVEGKLASEQTAVDAMAKAINDALAGLDYINGWRTIDSDKYYYKNGEPLKGWLKDGGSWYYLDPATGVMQVGFVTVGNSKYFLDADGIMKTGWIKEDGNWYYANASGVIQTGWLQQGSTWYYLKPDAGEMATGWLKVGTSWYYFKDGGAMATGWVKDGNTWYYMSASGAMTTGWVKVGSSWYYMKASGAMAANEWCNGYWLNANGTWTYQPRGSWHKDSTGWWFGDTSGWYAKNTTIIIDGTSYSFNASGYLK